MQLSKNGRKREDRSTALRSGNPVFAQFLCDLHFYSMFWKILSPLYLIWSYGWFIIYCIVAFVLIMLGQLLPEKTAHPFRNFILRLYGAYWPPLAGVRVKTIDKDKMDRNEPSVLVVNHNSFIDTPINYGRVRHHYKTLAKSSLTKIPLLGAIIKAACILVDRKDPKSREESFERMRNAVQSGISILIFAEGTQNRTEADMQPFYSGAFRLAIGAQAPVQPIVISGTRWILPPDNYGKLKPGKVLYRFLDPVPTIGLTPDDIPELKEKVRNMMIEAYREDLKTLGIAAKGVDSLTFKKEKKGS